MPEGKKSHKKAVITTISCVVVVLLLIAGGFALWITHGLGSYAKMSIRNIDFSKVPDGTYKGKFTGGRFSNTVEVTVKGGKVNDIRVAKDVTFNKPATPRELFDRIIKAQSLKVDTVTGATVTSKAYLKAIQNALSSAP